MHTLGNYIIRGRMQAMGIISLLAVFSLLLPVLFYPFMYPICGVPLALLTMRRGPAIGFQVLTGSFVLTTVLYWLLGIRQDVIQIIALTVWLPVYCCAVVLRLTNAQVWMILAAGLIGILSVTGLQLYMGDVAEWWRGEVGQIMVNFLAATDQAQPQEILDTILSLMNALMVSGMIVNLILSTLIARWWQSLLFNPGGFKIEFAAITLPRGLLLVVFSLGMILLLAGHQQIPLLRDILILTVIPYVFQGVAAVHRAVRKKNLSVYWLVCMYILMFSLPMILFIACLGMMDSLFFKRNAHP